MGVAQAATLPLETLAKSPLGVGVLGLGLITALYLSYSISCFVHFHFLHRSGLPRYQHPRDSKERAWALVTGASDGIGKGFAQELCHRGFNVVIHGRNKTKLRSVADDLKKDFPEATVRLAVLDAYPISEKTLDEMIASLDDLPVTVLINNVGGAGPIVPIFRQLNGLSYDDIATLIGINLDFAVALTAKLLPAFRSRQPALIINVSSFTARVPSPYLCVYAGTKAFIESWSRSLASEMKADGDDVEVLGLVVGEVAASFEREKPTSFVRPSSRAFARSALDKVGCGRRIIAPYIGHDLAGIAMEILPQWVTDSVLIGVARDMKRRAEKIAKEA